MTMNFKDYVNKIDRAMSAPVTGDVVNIELDNIKVIKANVVEHSDKSVTLYLDNPSWNALDRHSLLRENVAKHKMAEFSLTFERNGERVNKKFLHQPPMEAAGITPDFVRNIAKSNTINHNMTEQGYKLKNASACLIETDQLPESDVTVFARNLSNTEARVTFECYFKKTDANRSRMFLESIDCSKNSKTAQHWSLQVKTGK